MCNYLLCNLRTRCPTVAYTTFVVAPSFTFHYVDRASKYESFSFSYASKQARGVCLSSRLIECVVDGVQQDKW